MQLFGTAGIRGITNRDITPEVATKIGLAYGTIFPGEIAVARDTRYGAMMIENAVISGLLSTGNEVHELGIVPLPIFSRYVADFMDGGIIVTGSHTPPQIIGIVAVDSLGRDLYWDKSRKIEDKFKNEDYRRAKWNNINEIFYDNAVEHYTKFIEKEAKNVDGFRIVIDLANGSGCGIINRILRNLGIEVKCINCRRKPIPNRPSEPRRTTLGRLIKIAKNFDLGAGVDVDADRIVFTGKNGAISEDTTGAIFAKRIAKRMVTPINSSSLADYLAREYGIKLVYCPVGPPEIAEYILRNNADFGYEESGKYFFPPKTLWGDSILSIVKLLQIMDREGKGLDELANEFPKYYQVKEKIEVPREIKRGVVEKIGDYLEKNMPRGVREILRMDGVKIVYDDSWLLLRASGTEDVIRVFSDSRSEKKAKELVEFGMKIVKKFISSISPLQG